MKLQKTGAVISALIAGGTPLALLANDGMAQTGVHPLVEVAAAVVMMMAVIGGSTFKKADR